jgi:hypothetical protein
MIMDELDFMKAQIARLLTRRDYHGLQYGRAGDPLVRGVLAVLLLKDGRWGLRPQATDYAPRPR